MAHYEKKNQDPIEIMEDKRRSELASVIYWLRKNCEFERIDGALHVCLVSRSTINLFGANASQKGEMMRLNIGLDVIMKKLNGGGGYHQLNDVMKACHMVADDLEREAMTRRREDRQRGRANPAA
ncbi:hypothetical protein HWC07_gp003 [Pantoea phage vB_PagM_LIET2]|uniref:Uncharacterized protein n=1 Tax=Pantoea phage vB_PagM_LIET2 TaxID=2508071 RepID=A0A411AW06_9CAUD|nr:hypothetical protein HWC07_gp003 [Pantoea phage vB_PagM_LIET2]QAX92255.1 hypothetical protein LIET2_gp003 [Pantoea phage vB_PagM_LIET2]UJH95901.1 hypothetical protein [Pantoea phage Nafs113]